MSLYRLGALILLSSALAACAFTFGEGPPTAERSPEERLRESNLLYREEQARLERLRQSFGTTTGSER